MKMRTIVGVMGLAMVFLTGVMEAAPFEELDLNRVSIRGTNMYATADQLNMAGAAFNSTGALVIGTVTLTNVHASASNSTVLIRWPANQATTMGTLTLKSLGATNILANGQKIRLTGLQDLNYSSVGEIINYAGVDFRIVDITSNSEDSAVDIWIQGAGAEVQIASLSPTGLIVRGSIESSGSLDVNGSADISGNGVVASNLSAATFNTPGAAIIGNGLSVTGNVTAVLNGTNIMAGQAISVWIAGTNYNMLAQP